MNPEQAGIDQKKLHIILSSLEKQFDNVSVGGELMPVFVFRNGQQNGELKFHRYFLADIHPDVKLQLFMESRVIPAILNNPARRIEVGTDGAITIAKRQP